MTKRLESRRFPAISQSDLCFKNCLPILFLFFFRCLPRLRDAMRLLLRPNVASTQKVGVTRKPTDCLQWDNGRQRLSTMYWLLAVALTLPLGCQGKVPTWGELTGTATTDPNQQPLPTPSQITTSSPTPVPPPSSQEIIAKFRTTPSHAIDDGLLASLKSLPDRREEITEIDARGGSISNQGLEGLSALTALQKLDVSNTRVDNAALEAISQVSSLEELRFDGPKLQDSGALNLAKLPNLKRLFINNVNLSPTGWAGLGQIPALEVLHISYSNLNDTTFPLLCEAETLQEILLDRSPVGDVGISHLGKLPNLQVIDISQCPVGGAGLLKATQGKGLNAMRSLTVWGCPLNDQGGLAVAALKDLEVLNLGNLPTMQDRHLTAMLRGHTQLKKLSINMNVLLTNQAMIAIKALPNLEHLNIEGDRNIDDRGLAQLKSSKNLRELLLSGTSCTPAGAMQLREFLPLVQITLEGYSTTPPSSGSEPAMP